MGGETGVMRIMNAGDEDVCCCDCGRIAHPTRQSIWPEHFILPATWRKRTEHEELRDRPRVRVTANGIGSALSDFFIFVIVLTCCVGAVSAYPKQEFSAVPDDPDDAQLESSCEGKLGTLKANTFGCNLFEHVCVMFCVLCSALPRQSAQEKDCGARPLESTWTAWPFTC